MQLYLIEAHVTTADQPFWARSWKASKADASKERTRFAEVYGLKRKDIEIKEVDIDTRKEGLLIALNKISNQTDGALAL